MSRKARLAAMAWVLPLVLLVSGFAQSAAMFCRMQGVVASKACCCPVAEGASLIEEAPATVQRQGCCESVVLDQGHQLAVVTPNFVLDHPTWIASSLTQIWAPSATLVLPLSAGTRDHPQRPPNRPLVVLKHAFLI